jgi:hypothetical protein
MYCCITIAFNGTHCRKFGSSDDKKIGKVNQRAFSSPPSLCHHHHCCTASSSATAIAALSLPLPLLQVGMVANVLQKVLEDDNDNKDNNNNNNHNNAQ